MKTKLLWLPSSLLAVVVLLFALSGLASGQGPDLTSLPTPTPVPLPPGTASSLDLVSQDALPDLIVTKIETQPAIPLVGQSTVISVTIKNAGSGILPPGNNFLTDLYINPPFDPAVNYHQLVSPTLGLPWGAQSFFVPPGGSYTFSTTWVFTDVKAFDIWALVDSNGENETDSNGSVTESNEANNAKKISVSVTTAQHFTHNTHQDFMTNMASTLDNSDPTGLLRLGRFMEPPSLQWPFTNASCQITMDSVAVSDYNMQTPDARINEVITGAQVKPNLIANGQGVVIAVWEDSRDGDIYNRDIYLRYSTDEGQTWQPEIRVNDDPPGNHVNQLNPVAALSEDGNLLVAWQDRRNGDYDIYTQRFILTGATLTLSGGNMLVGGAPSYNAGDQENPTIAVDAAGGFHVAWQDNRNNSYDIFATSYIPGGGSYTWRLVRRVHDDFGLTQQENPSIKVLDWLEPTGVAYTIDANPPYTVTVTGVYSQPATMLVVAWEDSRNGSSDIALVASADRGETFGVDQFITNSPADGHQRNPDVALTKSTTEIDFTVPLPDGSQSTVKVQVPTSDIHTVWEGYSTPANLDRDIYYNVSKLVVEQFGTSNEFRFQLSVGSSNEKINQNDARDWQTAPVDQSGPALTAIPCGPDAEEEAWNVFIAWADGRNYDSFNQDIYYTVKSTCGAAVAGNQMLNDGVRLHDFDASDPNYDDYDPGHPPPSKQLNPSVAADIQLEGLTVSGGYLYLAWEDDRAGNPQVEKDVYFARSNLTLFNQGATGIPFGGAGSQISNILDSGREDTTWYTVDWTAAKPSSTYVTIQTRLGDTIAEVLASDWYPQRFPYQPQPGDCWATSSGAPSPGYDAPGQHIEDASGNFWPQARYIQYRVNFYTRDETHTPELDNLTIYFDQGASGSSGGHYTYLPLILR
jgi:hypothetical protein